jgi:hypothetical protein
LSRIEVFWSSFRQPASVEWQERMWIRGAVALAYERYGEKAAMDALAAILTKKFGFEPDPRNPWNWFPARQRRTLDT